MPSRFPARGLKPHKLPLAHRYAMGERDSEMHQPFGLGFVKDETGAKACRRAAGILLTYQQSYAKQCI